MRGVGGLDGSLLLPRQAARGLTSGAVSVIWMPLHGCLWASVLTFRVTTFDTQQINMLDERLVPFSESAPRAVHT